MPYGSKLLLQFGVLAVLAISWFPVSSWDWDGRLPVTPGMHLTEAGKADMLARIHRMPELYRERGSVFIGDNRPGIRRHWVETGLRAGAVFMMFVVAARAWKAYADDARARRGGRRIVIDLL